MFIRKATPNLSRLSRVSPVCRRWIAISSSKAARWRSKIRLKAAMDWKVRKNMAAGRGERGTEILHFRRAFHGRSGYTMSLTNTDPRKTDLFAKFDWPRVSCPSHRFFVAGIGTRSRCDRAREKIRTRNSRLHRPARHRHLRHHHRADPGRRRRQSFPRRMAARNCAKFAMRTTCC